MYINTGLSVQTKNENRYYGFVMITMLMQQPYNRSCDGLQYSEVEDGRKTLQRQKPDESIEHSWQWDEDFSGCHGRGTEEFTEDSRRVREESGNLKALQRFSCWLLYNEETVTPQTSDLKCIERPRYQFYMIHFNCLFMFSL